MAAGTVVSRLSGFVRASLLAAALGTGLHADVFNIANTIPNMLYILLAGGVFNAVLVPQLVKAIRNDPDGGAAYTNRVITLAALFLGLVSILLVVAAPLVMRVLVDPSYFDASNAEARDSMITFARYCLPQVFFYGMFVLVGQVLNARRSFGPMMWAPIANNVISVGVLVIYLFTIGVEKDAIGYSAGAEALLGIGSTLGIAAQFLILIPYLRRSGFTFRPRFDFRGSGLGLTFRLGVWTVAFVIVNQIAYTVVVRLASSGSADGGTGYTVYSNAFLLVMVPHAIITVSLATAVLPRLAGFAVADDLRGLAGTVTSTIRSTYALALPVLALIPVLAPYLASLVFGWGAAADTYSDFVPALSFFALGIFFFTSHYLVLRGFYALEQTRRVFFIQCAIAVVNIVAAVALTRGVDPEQTAPRLVIAYAIAYAVGAAISYRQLSVVLGGLGGRELLRFAVRIAVVVGLATGIAYGAREGLEQLLDDTSKVAVLLRLAVISGIGLGAYLGLARLFRVAEVTEVTALVTSRFRRPR
ncbi:murein biosynthesis integral membrane protein MurJ [Nocardioides marmoriginsengisoli]|uniref:Murein biosynthesis integral membrane protein MurJ n=2 Tax=Nocardioides marmoriginsengisoli TaxID=661483 RepID=A0A3N0CC90_9ACTN|nr:murein biosynthesis integral membrane protein MurJ [Nocardioides marmoriginsengisoli]